MSNASNLSTLANVLDDGSDGQFLKSTGSGGVAFDTVAAGAVVYATADLLPLSGNSAGDMAYVTATNRFYINNGSGWYSVSLVNTNPNITSVQDAGSNTTPFTLATDGTATVITVTAADPEEVPLTYGYSVTSGSLNGSTVTQGTGSNTNVFTVTPHASQDATFTLTFTASDGINQATSANAFSLSFVTIVTDSNHTTLLATATGTSDNNNITDSSSNSHNITVNGDAYAGTFSPYRSGGYSMSFNGTDESFEPNHSSASGLGTTWSVSYWANIPSSGATNGAPYIFDFDRQYSSGNGFALQANLSFKNFSLTTSSVGSIINTATGLTCFDKWSYYVITHSSGTTTFYIDGSSVGSSTNSGMANVAAQCVQQLVIGADRYATSSYHTKMDIRDFHVRSAAHNGAINNEAAVADSNTVVLAAHKPYLASQTGASTSLTPVINNDVSTKPFSPYDYNEYSATDHGGSVYFDGSGDYLISDISSNIFSVGTGDFTAEGWFYFPDDTTDISIIGSGISGGFDFRRVNDGTIRIGRANAAWDTTSAALSLANRWCHIAAVRSSGTVSIYVNGVAQTISSGASNTENYNSISHRISVGYNGFGSARYGYGNYADIRLTTSAVYSSNFTPPTAPLSSSGASLHIKGTDASIIDKSQSANLKLIDNTTGSTTQVKFAGSKSMYFDGSGDYITSSSNSSILGNGDFTVELWLYASSVVSGYRCICSQGSAGTSFRMFVNDTSIQVWSGASRFIDYNNSTTANTWYHIAYSHSSSGYSLYVDGSLAFNYGSEPNLDRTLTSINIGGGDTSSIDGYIQDFRITKGLARYTANFTPPSAPLEG